MTSYDVIVIGSGPAGCAAAATCVQAGLNVLMVTDASKITDAISAAPHPLESIHPGVSLLLEKIGASGVEHAATCALYSGIYAGSTYAPLGEDSAGVWQGMHINRQIFNTQLVRRMQETGVAVSFSEKVEGFILESDKVIGVKTGTTNLWATYIIDATGKKSIVGKGLNFKRKYFSPPVVCWTGISGNIERFPFDQHAAHFIPHQNGWTWLAPQPPHHCAWTRLHTKGEKDFSPPDELKDYPVIGEIRVANMRWRMFRPVCSEGIVLCGDAAGILDPAAGQGIFNALTSGIVAGSTVVSCIQQPALASFHLARYDDWFVQQFETKAARLTQYYAEHAIQLV